MLVYRYAYKFPSPCGEKVGINILPPEKAESIRFSRCVCEGVRRLPETDINTASPDKRKSGNSLF